MNSGIFIYENGTTTDCGGIAHADICKQRGTSLSKVLKSGVCRVKIYGEILAIEAINQLTIQQIDTIGRILRENDFYSLTVYVANVYRSFSRFTRRITIGNLRSLIE